MAKQLNGSLNRIGFDEYDYMYGADYAAFHFGLAYSNPFKEMFTQAMAAKVSK
jgi:hypothetical protein